MAVRSSASRRACSKRIQSCQLPRLVSAVLIVVLGSLEAPWHLLFAVAKPPRARPQATLESSSRLQHVQGHALCGQALPQGACRWQKLPATLTVGAATGALSWIDPRRWTLPQSQSQMLSPREWIRLYRILGISEDSSREQVMKATAQLRRKYADDQEALERVERANLWVMTRIISKKEDEMELQRRDQRRTDLATAPKRFFQNRVAGYIPPSMRQMIEVPDKKHFRRTSSLMGLFSLLALCVPTQATNFVGLGAATALGFIYQRGRPEPVRDERGQVGEVRKINFKEMGASLAVVAAGVVIGLSLTFAIMPFAGMTPFTVLFCLSTIAVLYIAALFLKVFECFDQ